MLQDGGRIQRIDVAHFVQGRVLGSTAAKLRHIDFIDAQTVRTMHRVRCQGGALVEWMPMCVCV